MIYMEYLRNISPWRCSLDSTPNTEEELIIIGIISADQEEHYSIDELLINQPWLKNPNKWGYDKDGNFAPCPNGPVYKVSHTFAISWHNVRNAWIEPLWWAHNG